MPFNKSRSETGLIGLASHRLASLPGTSDPVNISFKYFEFNLGTLAAMIDILNDKTTKLKAKVTAIAQLLLDQKISIRQLTDAAKKEDDVNKGTLIEAIEHATKTEPACINEKAFAFLIDNLRSSAPRVKWESARAIANTAQLFPKLHKKAVVNLLDNTEHPSTVVRWSAAGALSKIIQCQTSLNKELIPAIKTIEKNEQDNAIKKIYQQGLKKAAK